MTSVMSGGKLVGIVTDGDLRRVFHSKRSMENLVAEEIMTSQPKTINENALADEALQIMEKNSVNHLLVMDESKTPIGVLGMHDLLKARIL